MHPAVCVDDLKKIYRKDAPPAVSGLSFSVFPGEVFGLLGPNGAGKTTTVGILTTRVRPTSGRAVVAGANVMTEPRRARQLLAVVPQRVNLDRSLTIRNNLLFHAAYHGVRRAERTARADELLQKMGLAEQADSRVDWLSGGLAQRVMIARALMHRPAVLFLDEPTAGLDPQARVFVHDRIADLREEGVTVVLTTHDMDEAEKLCDRVGIIDHGSLLVLDSPAALMRDLPGGTTVTIAVTADSPDRQKLAAAIKEINGVDRVEEIGSPPPAAMAASFMAPGSGGGFPGAGGFPGMAPFPGGPPSGPGGPQFRLYISARLPQVLPVLLRILEDAGAALSDLSIGVPSLEDVFLQFTGRELR